MTRIKWPLVTMYQNQSKWCCNFQMRRCLIYRRSYLCWSHYFSSFLSPELNSSDSPVFIFKALLYPMMAFNKSHLPDIHPENVLSLNVLLLGEKQSGRSSVGNALIGQYFYSLWILRCQLYYITGFVSVNNNYYYNHVSQVERNSKQEHAFLVILQRPSANCFTEIFQNFFGGRGRSLTLSWE